MEPCRGNHEWGERQLNEFRSPISEARAEIALEQAVETSFEKRRGISSVEVRAGFSQVHVLGCEDAVVSARIAVLKAIASAGVSIDFLKLTTGGLSFLISDPDSTRLAGCLDLLSISYRIHRDMRIVLVHAVNMRDEEGLIADVMRKAASCGVEIEHVTDMHDRMLMVVGVDHAEKLREALEELKSNGVNHAH